MACSFEHRTSSILLTNRVHSFQIILPQRSAVCRLRRPAPPPIWMHAWAGPCLRPAFALRISPRMLRRCDHAPCFSVFPRTSFGGRWKWQQFEWLDWPPRVGCAWESSLHKGAIHTSPFSGRLTYCTPARSSLTEDGKERDCDDADGGGATCERATAWQGAQQACLAHQHERDCNRFFHIPATALPVAHTLPLVNNSASMFSCEPCIQQRLLSNTCMHNIV